MNICSPGPNFAGTVTFACVGAPSGPTCSISPASLPVNGQTTTQLNLVVNSTRTSGLVRPDFNPDTRILYARIPWQVVLFGLLLPAAFLLRRNLGAGFNFGRLRFSYLAFELAIAAGLMISGCGGGAVSGNLVTPSSGPVPSTYPLKVVATSGNVTVSLSLTLNVQ